MEFLKKALDFLERNVRYLHLPQELQDIILEAERLLKEKAMTTELLKGMSSLFAAHLVRPEIRESFQNGEALLAGKIQVGKKADSDYERRLSENCGGT